MVIRHNWEKNVPHLIWLGDVFLGVSNHSCSSYPESQETKTKVKTEANLFLCLCHFTVSRLRCSSQSIPSRDKNPLNVDYVEAPAQNMSRKLKTMYGENFGLCFITSTEHTMYLLQDYPKFAQNTNNVSEVPVVKGK